MKTIDEAIAHAREVAENNRKESNYDAFSLDYMNEMHKKNCVKCAEEHEQLAEWLEELKEARKGFEENRKAGYKRGYSDRYAKAIDEFVERLKERIVGMQMAELQGEDICPCAENGKECPYINQDIGCQYCAREHTIKEIDEIAEEMRGVKNEVN